MLRHRLNGTYVLRADLCQPPTDGAAKFMLNERSVERTVLPNGLTILTERMENVRSVAMGVWVRAGSRHEIAELNGISHFVEHMVFKGTETRTAQRIAREVDAIGGNLDAFTGKETICFNIKVLDEHVPVALDVLSDLVLHPIFAEGDIQRERGVIFEEIKMDEDNPDFLVHEIFTQNFWKGPPAGQADPGNEGDGGAAGAGEVVRLLRRPLPRRQCGLHRGGESGPSAVCG